MHRDAIMAKKAAASAGLLVMLSWGAASSVSVARFEVATISVIIRELEPANT